MGKKVRVDKKPLIVVSLCAVILLVMGSLSNAVGYQLMKSTVNDSPLFQTRTQRATNQPQNILTSQYLGMEKGNVLQFPMKDNKIESLIKVIEIISEMDDRTFRRYTEMWIQKVVQDDILYEITYNEIMKVLSLLRTKSESFISSLNTSTNQQVTFDPFPSVCWFPGCKIFLMFATFFIAVCEIMYSIFHPDFDFCPV